MYFGVIFEVIPGSGVHLSLFCVALLLLNWMLAGLVPHLAASMTRFDTQPRCHAPVIVIHHPGPDSVLSVILKYLIMH